MLTVGLTGNYGMGKSTVLRMFRDLGAITVQTDEIVDGLLREGTVISEIRSIFGEDVFSQGGLPDKRKLAAVVFRNRELRERLEGILHPLVLGRIEEVLNRQAKEKNRRVVVIEIPLLFEKGYSGRFQRTITVRADKEVTLRRLQESGVSRGDALLRLGAQMPVEEKAMKADFTIDNSGSLEATRTLVAALFELLLAEAKDRRTEPAAQRDSERP